MSQRESFKRPEKNIFGRSNLCKTDETKGASLSDQVKNLKGMFSGQLRGVSVLKGILIADL